MRKILASDTAQSQIYKLLLGAIGPRPIAFASTVDERGNPNLSPFSFFNFFGVNPTTLIFSPSRRNRDNTTKHTYENVKVVPEVVINVVTYEMVQQASLASTEYAKGVDEFYKAGFTKVTSEMVRPFRVKESPVQMECKVRQVIETGQGPGAGNLIVCEILVIHISEEILAEDGLIDQQKIHLVGRLGREWYSKAFGDAIFKVRKPLGKPGIGIDGLPDKIRFSKYLTGNDLGMLGNLESLPDQSQINETKAFPVISQLLKEGKDQEEGLINIARSYLLNGEAFEALKVLMLIK